MNEKSVAEGRVEKTQPNIFSADETAHECPLMALSGHPTCTPTNVRYRGKADMTPTGRYVG